jgi:hypothetical protein
MLSCMNDVALMSYAAVTMRHYPSKDTRTLVACVRHLQDSHERHGRFRRLCVIVDASGARLERVNPYESITPCIESGTHVQISNAL